MLSFIFLDKQQLSWTYLYAKNIMASIKNYKYSIPANISQYFRFRKRFGNFPKIIDILRTLSKIFRWLPNTFANIWRAFLTNFEGIKNCCDWYKLRAKEHFLVMACFYSHFFIVLTPTPLNWTLRSKIMTWNF